MTTESHIGHLNTVINVVTPFMHKDSNALQKSTNVKFATNMVTFPVYATKRRPRVHHKNSCRNPKAHQLYAGPMYAQDSANHSYCEESSSDESFCLQLQAKSNHAEGKQIPNPVYLITNLEGKQISNPVHLITNPD